VACHFDFVQGEAGQSRERRHFSFVKCHKGDGVRETGYRCRRAADVVTSLFVAASPEGVGSGVVHTRTHVCDRVGGYQAASRTSLAICLPNSHSAFFSVPVLV
jgi:hypothetical protein